MTRIDTVREYFIERFFELLTLDPEFTGLTEPAELFTAGVFNAAANTAGFVRIPTMAALDDRIAAANGDQAAQLQRFQRVLGRTLHELFGSLVNLDVADALAAVTKLSPVIRHPDSQNYWPIDVGNYLSTDDGLLRGQYYDAAGTRALAGNLFSVMFDNPAVWSGAAVDPPAYAARQPFVATIALDPPAPAYPTYPLTAGHLNLPAADARLTPGKLVPALYAEVKSLAAALRVNAHYSQTAERGGRFEALRRNRIHADPLLPLARGLTASTAVVEVGDPLMVIFHAFYPADDAARRLNNGVASNREFHHLAVGILLPPNDVRAAVQRVAVEPLLFVSSSPTMAQVLPLRHPSVGFVDEEGRDNPGGSHPVIWANSLSMQGYGVGTDNIDNQQLAQNGKEGLDYDPNSWQWWAGLGSAIAAGAAAGSPGGPIGAAIGALVGLLVFLLAWLLKKLFGGNKNRTKEWTENEPWPGQTASTQDYSQPAANDIAPLGTTPAAGGETPARAYNLELIPHFPSANLYGLAFEGGDTFRIIDDSVTRDMLAWRAFEGGVGYQFDRPAPGRVDCSGASLRNYFDLFTRRYMDVVAARSDVIYFDA